MNKLIAIRNHGSAIVIVGAGPAGASLSIRLAKLGFAVSLIERETFPRHKLCGEFISPECLGHFEELGVLDEMLVAGGEHIHETRFFSQNGRSVAVPSRWFGGDFALSLSRAEMDNRLLKRAKCLGVDVREGQSVSGVLDSDSGSVRGLRLRSNSGEITEITGDIIIDATGRSRVVARLVEKKKRSPASNISPARPKFVGFKTHLRNSGVPQGVCEIYSFRGGYSGLSRVEGGHSNHCFIVQAEKVQECGSDPERVVSEVVFQNPRARDNMELSVAAGDWLAVAVDSFGSRGLRIAPNIFAVGDSAAFVDPFTGSGMLMALESSQVLASCIYLQYADLEKLNFDYAAKYNARFRMRLLVCSWLRNAAFSERSARAVITAAGYSDRIRESVAAATRRDFRPFRNRI
ncbi:MAG: NAD(P)/FAD-dependent oxidoreductase [Blastocatellia bacterium]